MVAHTCWNHITIDQLSQVLGDDELGTSVDCPCFVASDDPAFPSLQFYPDEDSEPYFIDNYNYMDMLSQFLMYFVAVVFVF